MKVHALREPPPPELAGALAEFETRFTYPLGPGRSFRISHGDDYPRFFRAMGPAVCFVAQKGKRVVGTLAVAIRPILMPDGTERSVAYVGDLKIEPGARGGLVLVRLGTAALEWGRPQADAAYGVVMDGTPTSPSAYSGRAGLPAFLDIGRVFVLRFPTTAEETDDRFITNAARGTECYRSLSRGRYAAWGGAPPERSETDPVWLMDPEGAACGRLEDTRRAKRLFDDEGAEMLSAHLACFAWRTPQAAARLINEARCRAALCGLPALFAAVAACELDALDGALGGIERVVAPATVFGAALPSGPAWNINSSEI